MAKTLTVNSNIKPIASNAIPTPSNLGKGEWAYGIINGEKRMFGNPTGSAVVEFTAPGQTKSIKSLSYEGATGIMTVTFTDNSTETINFPVENFLASASFDHNTNILTLTLTDETNVTVDLSDLIDVYTAENGGGLSVSNGAFSIASGGVTSAMLATEVTNAINAAKTLTAAANQPVSISGNTGSVSAIINASAAVSGGGIKVTGGALELDESSVTFQYSVTEI